MIQPGTQNRPPLKEEVFTSLVLVPVAICISPWLFCVAGLIFLGGKQQYNIIITEEGRSLTMCY